tara:strand:+ start:90 stop:407 length:318 start_codon:yes stop_codon:yes gene_type:complete
MQKRRKKSLKKHYSKFKVLGVLFIAQAVFLIFNEFGLKKWIELNKTKNNLQSEIQTLLTQQINLQDEIVKLNIDQDYIEKIAREKFMMVKPGEKVFRVIESKTMK